MNSWMADWLEYGAAGSIVVRVGDQCAYWLIGVLYFYTVYRGATGIARTSRHLHGVYGAVWL